MVRATMTRLKQLQLREAWQPAPKLFATHRCRVSPQAEMQKKMGSWGKLEAGCILLRNDLDWLGYSVNGYSENQNKASNVTYLNVLSVQFKEIPTNPTFCTQVLRRASYSGSGVQSLHHF